ncbi:coiled-coil alpha-helical rod protein 1 [Echeneis naucrates]|uniref:Coiled-coil alpha-helical rod protein 1 n=1 Tax=Echeneis naucrates TaxID=173247 RepID=A0A665WXC0_ECHNA|nr:coiled-coil alpha-helical rod protein 1-like [Echeneis naucrates]
MERHKLGKERLIVPTDFTSPATSRSVQEDLVPPSHFASSVQTAGTQRGIQIPSTPTLVPWMTSDVTSAPPGKPSPDDPWLAITQARQEILELRKENQRILMLQESSIRGRLPVDHQSNVRARPADTSEQWSKWELECCLEVEKHKAEAERLKGQVKALKESVAKHREEVKDTENTVSRQTHELEATRGDLCKAKAELIQLKEELVESNAQKEKINSQLDRLQTESAEEIKRLRRDVERKEEASWELTRKVEVDRLQAEEEAKQQSLRLSEHLEEMQRKKEAELQQLTASHSAELAATRKINSELQDRLQSMTSEVLLLKSTLTEVSTERDGLKEHLSQMGQAFETQSATLHSLRNYIGQYAPEKREKDQLNETVERLNKEKATLQMTTELLTVRLNSVNEILALQEEEMQKKTSVDSLVKNGQEGLQVIQLWRKKVFGLCVQLRSKDIELRGEKDNLLSKLRSMEQQLQQEQHRASILQHSLDDRIAELDLERVEKETLKQDLAQAHKDNSQLKLQAQRSEVEIKVLTEAVSRFSLAFEGRMAEMDTAQTRLNTFTQRLTFAKRQVETIQGLIIRRVALQKVQRASKRAEQPAHSITNLQTELSLVCGERDKLAQELKRTPELIEKALADLKEQYESKQRQQKKELEESLVEVRQAVAGREKAEQSLQQIQAQLEETKVNLEKLCSELLVQQEHSERALQEKVSEIEDRCAEKLRAMEVQVNTARREHTKAVMTLRQFERELARKQELRESQYLSSTHRKREIENEWLKETEKDTTLHLASVAERGLMSEYPRVDTKAPHSAVAPRERRPKPSDRSDSVGAKVQVPAEERLLSVLEELHTLSAAVVNSSEDSAEEEEEGQS